MTPSQAGLGRYELFSIGLLLNVLFLFSIAFADQPKAAVSLNEINPPKAPKHTVVIRGANVIDGKGGADASRTFRSHRVVVIQGAKIAVVGEMRELPANAEIVDATGMTLLPGFIDSHFHIERDYEMPRLVLSHGVTSLRDPGQWIWVYDPIRNSPLLQPRCFVAGPHLDRPPPAHPADAFLVSNVVDVATAVNRFIDEGASVIKCYYRLPADFIAAACTAAHKHGVPVTAHLELVDAREAILAGLDGVEHVTSFGTALAEPKEAEAFRSAVNQDNEARRKERYRLWSRLDFDRSSRVTPVIDLIVRKHVTLSPTLAVFERRPRDRGATEMEWRGFENMSKFIALCHRAGAKIVVGSHTEVPHAARGWAYHRELQLLQESGLSNSEIISAATLENARYFRVEDRLGSIEPGKFADLLLVDGDPLKDIDALRNVRGVMLNGNWVIKPQAK